MKIACIDKTAAERVLLQRRIEEAYEACRHSVGHLTNAQVYPVSREEALLNSAPDVITIGPVWSIEESYSACRDLYERFPNTPIVLFVQEEFYTLRILRRFQKICAEVFAITEAPIRIVHKLSSLEQRVRPDQLGKLIVCSGVKGGVGTTTFVTALAHAAEALGKSALVLDLSRSSALVQYMSAQRWHAPEYATALTDKLPIDRALAERCITTAPNGISLLLPPSGGLEMRESWLRDPERFELSLQLIDTAREMYQIVLVDLGGAEGILPWALLNRAHARVLVSSNDPASVHLLSSALSELAEIPGEANTHVILNQLSDSALHREDVIDFLYLNDNFQAQMALVEPLPFDARGKNWIGTGNTFYTESAAGTQQVIDDALNILLLEKTEIEKRQEKSTGIFSGVRRLTRKMTRRKKRVEGKLQLLPEPHEINPQTAGPLALPQPAMPADTEVQPPIEAFYEAPRAVS